MLPLETLLDLKLEVSEKRGAVPDEIRLHPDTLRHLDSRRFRFAGGTENLYGYIAGMKVNLYKSEKPGRLVFMNGGRPLEMVAV